MRGPIGMKNRDKSPILVKTMMFFRLCSLDILCRSILTHASIQVRSSKYLITDMAINQNGHCGHPVLVNQREAADHQSASI